MRNDMNNNNIFSVKMNCKNSYYLPLALTFVATLWPILNVIL